MMRIQEANESGSSYLGSQPALVGASNTFRGEMGPKRLEYYSKRGEYFYFFSICHYSRLQLPRLVLGSGPSDPPAIPWIRWQLPGGEPCRAFLPAPWKHHHKYSAARTGWQAPPYFLLRHSAFRNQDRWGRCCCMRPPDSAPPLPPVCLPSDPATNPAAQRHLRGSPSLAVPSSCLAGRDTTARWPNTRVWIR